MSKKACPSMASSAGSFSPTGSRALSDSTWSKPDGGRRSTIISTKPRILEAVREAKGEQSAQLIDHLKKAEMAKEAERLLDGTGWLPEPLRTPETETADTTVGNTAEETETLPAFLADDEESTAELRRPAPRPRARTHERALAARARSLRVPAIPIRAEFRRWRGLLCRMLRRARRRFRYRTTGDFPNGPRLRDAPVLRSAAPRTGGRGARI
jgi:hypothetical protein